MSISQCRGMSISQYRVMSIPQCRVMSISRYRLIFVFLRTGKLRSLRNTRSYHLTTLNPYGTLNATLVTGLSPVNNTVRRSLSTCIAM